MLTPDTSWSHGDRAVGRTQTVARSHPASPAATPAVTVSSAMRSYPSELSKRELDTEYTEVSTELTEKCLQKLPQSTEESRLMHILGNVWCYLDLARLCDCPVPSGVLSFPLSPCPPRHFHCP